MAASTGADEIDRSVKAIEAEGLIGAPDGFGIQIFQQFDQQRLIRYLPNRAKSSTIFGLNLGQKKIEKRWALSRIMVC